MFIFLYGPDTYRAREKVNEIISLYKKTQITGASFSYFNEVENNFAEFKNVIDTVSMFDAKKLIVAKDFTSSKDFSEEFISWDGRKLIKDSSDTVCVFIDEKPDKKDKMFKWLVKNSRSQEFKLLEADSLAKWAKKRAEKIGLAIESIAISQLVSYTGPDLWLLDNELNRLKAYKADLSAGRGFARQASRATSDDLVLFLKPKLQSHIFSFLDAATIGDASKAFRFFKGHIEGGENAAQIFSALHTQFRNIATAQHFLTAGRVSYMGSETKLHPFVIKKSISFARNLGSERLKKIYSRIVELDRKIKTGETSAEEALGTFILRI